MKYPVYMVNNGLEIKYAETWDECKELIKGSFCKFKRCNNETDVNKFISESKEYFKKNPVNTNKKIYVVIYDNNSYIFNLWKECKEFVETHKNVIYKSFIELSDAQRFIEQNIKVNDLIGIEDVVYGFVDGSYNKSTNCYGYGFALCRNNEVLFEDCGQGESIDNHRQVTGELVACVKAIEKAISMGEKRIIIVYDYMGIEMWANGSWQAKSVITQRYVNSIRDLSERISIDFYHVNSHVHENRIKGLHEFNDLADNLAKRGANLEK